MPLEFFVIVCVFAGVLAVFLYFYLFKHGDRKGSKEVVNVEGMVDEEFEEEVAKRLDVLFQEVDALEEKLTTIYDYVKEVARTRKKK